MNAIATPAQACRTAQRSFSGYLDGAISGREMQSVSAHLDACPDCREDFASLRGMQRVLAAVGPAKPPADLSLKLRLAISHERGKRQRLRDTLGVRWTNLVRPVMLQASAGFAGAVMLLGTIAMLVGALGAPQAVLANDEPLGALTSPHYLYSEARQQPVITPEDTTIVIEADVNAAGRVYDYTIVSGPQDERTLAQVRDQVMLLVYQPALAFGEPVRGRVLITFSGVSVHG